MRETLNSAGNSRSANRAGLAALAIAAFAVSILSAFADAGAQQPPQNPAVRPPANAVQGGPPPPPSEKSVPSDKPGNYDVEMWRKLRGGAVGQVSIPDKKAGVLVQSEGETWRNFRGGPLPRYGAWAMGGMLALLALFFVVRGRIRIDSGWSGHTIVRFTTFERMAHWLLAASFLILAVTGLNVLYGRQALLPLIGKPAFSTISIYGKLLHNYVAFAFMLALAMTFVRWVVHNFPGWRDIVWLAKAGGLLVKNSHPPAWKFNAGQKILFWLVMLGGVSMSLSGLSLLVPERLPLVAKAFAVSNGLFGTHLPTALSATQEMQYAVTWHSITALALVCVIMGHIYIGTLGMQGAYAAMGSGKVDVNWAREHHCLWAERELAKIRSAAAAVVPEAKATPAE